MNITDFDRAVMAATVLGEARNQGFEGMAAVADVIMNRAAAERNFMGGVNPTPASIAMAGRGAQFNNWSPRDPNFSISRRAAFSPEKLTAQERAIMAEAYKAVDAVAFGPYRGITQGATYYSNPTDISARQRAAHAKEGLFTGKRIGDHVFYGKEYDPSKPFDLEAARITHAIGIPEYSEVPPDIPALDPAPFDDISLPDPIGQVDFAGNLPDITPQQPASAGFSLGQDQFNDIFSAGFPGAPLGDFTPFDQSPVDFSDVRQGLTEQQAIANLGFQNQRPSDNVEIRHGSSFFGDDIDAAVLQQDMKNREADFVVGVGAGHFGPLGMEFSPIAPDLNLAAVNAYEVNPASASLEDYSDITRGVLHDDYSPLSQSAFNDIYDAGFPSAPDIGGYHAGTGLGTGQNLDFNAPSLEQRNADTLRQDRINAFDRDDLWSKPTSVPQDVINDSLMAELAPQTETYTVMEKRTRDILDKVDVPYDMQAAYMGDWEDKIGVPRSVPQQKTVKRTVTEMVPVQKTRIVNKPVVSMPLTRPAVRRAAPEGWNPGVGADGWGGYTSADSGLAGFDQNALGSAYDSFINDTAPTQEKPSSGWSMGDIGLPDISLPGLGKSSMPDDAFMNGMASPDYAKDYSPGFLDGWTGDALKGAGLGLVTGGLPGAVMGGLMGGFNVPGRVGGWASNMLGGNGGFGFSGFSNPFAGLSAADVAAFMKDGNYTDREPTRNTGYEGGATRGDGSYSDHAGYNDNNPQGIL